MYRLQKPLDRSARSLLEASILRESYQRMVGVHKQDNMLCRSILQCIASIRLQYEHGYRPRFCPLLYQALAGQYPNIRYREQLPLGSHWREGALPSCLSFAHRTSSHYCLPSLGKAPCYLRRNRPKKHVRSELFHSYRCRLRPHQRHRHHPMAISKMSFPCLLARLRQRCFRCSTRRTRLRWLFLRRQQASIRWLRPAS